MIYCENCKSEDVKIVERKDPYTKKVYVDFLKCNCCQHVEFIEEVITKRALKKKRSAN